MQQEQQQEQASSNNVATTKTSTEPYSSSDTPYHSMEIGAAAAENNNNNDDQFKDEDGGEGDDGNYEEELSLAPSIVESVMTADGIHDMTGFSIVCLVILIGDMSRGVFFHREKTSKCSRGETNHPTANLFFYRANGYTHPYGNSWQKTLVPTW